MSLRGRKGVINARQRLNTLNRAQFGRSGIPPAIIKAKERDARPVKLFVHPFLKPITLLFIFILAIKEIAVDGAKGGGFATVRGAEIVTIVFCPVFAED